MITFDRAYFEALYQRDIDPWQFRLSEYERLKYAKTIAALPDVPFDRCLELGCSIGELTRRLLSRCRHIVAIDTSIRALEEARRSCPDARVDFRQAHLPDGELGLNYDLVVASEILYYLDAAALRCLALRLAKIVTPGACIVSVHWTGQTNYPLAAGEATRLCFDEAGITSLRTDIGSAFRLDMGRFPV
ncbi:class I SAM-dependent methyltransferase [Dyella acidiphila]|uniref:Class I SAM-dependent methyltransferase n=1 Tax=Dyella acidiphila TaxID=2775866 RepID=A0ABR9GC06_9GAMM|nr:class I SAM-dependent methyltransferase [Dyella acidiphila]MBE1161566.1 class I SAM-dependent methyltransferase [Dyella acidiphila]